MEPTQTEYKRVIFDSKSEAVFARTLDIANLFWFYHPPEYCGHKWDFTIVGRYWRPTILVEYKPSMPTNKYVDNLTEKMRENPIESVVIWGNPWDGIDPDWDIDSCSYIVYPIFTHWGKYGWGDFVRLADNGMDCPMSSYHRIEEMFGITEEMAQKAKNFRFDLV